MKLQVITTLAVLFSVFSSTTDAGRFDLGQVVRTAQKVNQAVNSTKFKGGRPQYETLPYYPPQSSHPVVKPLPHPIHKPICKKPIPHPHPGHVHKPICKTPVNRPPVKCYAMKLMNNAGAEVYYNLNNNGEYETMPMNDVDVVKSHTRKSHLISYHNGQELVEYELDVNGTYSFEWQGETLQLLEVQG